MALTIANAAAKVVNLAGGIVAEGHDIAGGYFVIDKLSNIPIYTYIVGQLCYCLDDNKFYQCDSSKTWVEANLGGGGGASEMSAIGFQLKEKENNGSTKKYLATNATISGVDDLQSSGIYIGTDGISVVGGNYNATYGFNGTKLLKEGGKLLSDNVEITGGTLVGFTLEDTKLYTEYSKTVANATIRYFMKSPNEINNVLYLSNSDITDFYYIGAGGIGNLKVIPTDGANNDGYSTLNTYMSAGKLFSNSAEITGGTLAGFTLGDGKLYTGSKNALYWTTLGGTYIGTDGIAIGHSLTAKEGGGYWYPGVVINASTGKLIANNVEITGGSISTSTLNGIVTIAQGGTGKESHINNAILTGSGSSALKNVTTANGAFYATTSNGAAKFGTLPVAQGGTGSTTAYGGAINLLKELSNINYLADKSVLIPKASITNDGVRTYGSTSGTIAGLILHVDTSDDYCSVSAENNTSTGTATYTVKYVKTESQIALPDITGIYVTIRILSIPYN